jgi:hypothetical protein
VHHLARGLLEIDARGRKLDTVPAPHEKLCAQMLFQRPDLLAYARLGHVQAHRRCRKAACFRDLKEHVKLPKVNHAIPST